MTLRELLRQWSRVSGWNLVAEFERTAHGSVLLRVREDKEFPHQDSTLCIKLMLFQPDLEGGWIKEVYGKLGQWGCSKEQYHALVAAMKNFDKEQNEETGLGDLL